MEALLLAGGMAERMGEAAQGLPKPLVPVAGYPLAEYTVGRLVAAGVTRVIVACRAGQEDVFGTRSAGSALRSSRWESRSRSVAAAGCGSPRRGGGRRVPCSRSTATSSSTSTSPSSTPRTSAPAPPRRSSSRRCARRSASSTLEDDGRITGFREAPLLDDWVNSGVYALGEEALARLPERGDHEQTTFPELAAEGKLRAHRHDGVWLTVNTPKDLRRAEEFIAEHPEWRPQRMFG